MQRPSSPRSFGFASVQVRSMTWKRSRCCSDRSLGARIRRRRRLPDESPTRRYVILLFCFVVTNGDRTEWKVRRTRVSNKTIGRRAIRRVCVCVYAQRTPSIRNIFINDSRFRFATKRFWRNCPGFLIAIGHLKLKWQSSIIINRRTKRVHRRACPNGH